LLTDDQNGGDHNQGRGDGDARQKNTAIGRHSLRQIVAAEFNAFRPGPGKKPLCHPRGNLAVQPLRGQT
jgi:hypothetical protein